MKHMYVNILLGLVFCAAANAQTGAEQQRVAREQMPGVIGRLSNDTPQGTRYTNITKTQPTINGRAENVHCGLKDRNGNLWFGTTGHGVFFYDGNSFTNITVIDGLNNNFVWSILEDAKGNILIGTGKGITLYDGNSFTNFTKYQHFAEQAIWELFEDRRGRIWVSTDDGTYFYDGKLFTNLTAVVGMANPKELILRNLNDIMEDNAGNLWFMSWRGEGLLKYDGQTVTQFAGEHNINDNMFHCVIEDRSGMLWFGSRDHGIFRYDGKTFTHISDPNGPGTDCIYAILEDSRGEIWFTTERSGVFCYDGKSFRQYRISETQPRLDASLNFMLILPQPQNSVFTVVEDKDGKLWFGTRNVGLYRYDGKEFKRYSE